MLLAQLRTPSRSSPRSVRSGTMTETVRQPSTVLTQEKSLGHPSVVTRTHCFAQYDSTAVSMTDTKKIALNVFLFRITLPRRYALRRSPRAAGRPTRTGTSSWACLRGGEASVAWTVPGPSRVLLEFLSSGQTTLNFNFSVYF